MGPTPFVVVTMPLEMSTTVARSPQVALAALRLGQVFLCSKGLAAPAAMSCAFSVCVFWAEVAMSLAALCLIANWISSFVATLFGAWSNVPL